VTAEAVGGQREERLAVGLLVQRDVAVARQVGRELRAAVDELRDVEEALRAQEVAVARLAGAQDGLERAAEDVARHRRQLAETLQLTALGREAHRVGRGLDDGRLARPVVAREQRHGRVEAQRLDRRDGRDVVREARPPLPRAAAQAEQVRTGAEAAHVAAASHARAVTGAA
jgi:hypothetical protein